MRSFALGQLHTPLPTLFTARTNALYTCGGSTLVSTLNRTCTFVALDTATRCNGTAANVAHVVVWSSRLTITRFCKRGRIGVIEQTYVLHYIVVTRVGDVLIRP